MVGPLTSLGGRRCVAPRPRARRPGRAARPGRRRARRRQPGRRRRSTWCPGLPLDGGRVLQAAVWGVTGNPHRGTVVAGWGGRVARRSLARLPAAAEHGARRAADRHRLPVRVRDRRASCGAARPPRSCPPGCAAGCRPAGPRRWPGVPSRSRRPAARRGGTPRPGGAGGQHRGRSTSRAARAAIVNEAAVLATPEDRRPWLPVSAVARVARAGPRAPRRHRRRAADPGHAERARPRSTSSLDADGSIFGVLVTDDVDGPSRRSASERPRQAAVTMSCHRMSPTTRGLVRRAPRPAARGGVGAAHRPQGPPPQHLAGRRASGSSPTGARSTTTT